MLGRRYLQLRTIRKGSVVTARKGKLVEPRFSRDAILSVQEHVGPQQSRKGGTNGASPTPDYPGLFTRWAGLLLTLLVRKQGKGWHIRQHLLPGRLDSDDT